MMIKIRYLLFGYIVLFALSGFSQEQVEKGHKQFHELAYSDAIISLENAVENGFGNARIYQELADSYYFNANYKASAKWYQLYFKKPNNPLPLYYFRYAQSLKSIGKLEKAEIVIAEMNLLLSAEKENLSKLNLKNAFEKRQKNSGRFKIEITEFNSTSSDYGPSYLGEQLVFASARDTGSIAKRTHSWTNQSFTDLYYIHLDSLKIKPTRFKKTVNSKFNESSAVFTKDGLTMYFTRNNFQNKKLGTDKNQTTLLKIYKAVKKDDNWEVIGALPFCDDSYNVAHPALSTDEKTMYFASDMMGGFGQSDLYKVPINEDGTFGKPVNLGSSINTMGRETFPFVSKNDALYFASDGHDGFGGLDVFVSQLDEKFRFIEPQNIGEPINSRMDDFGFIINTDTKKGFFTSNRSGGMGMDDIYAFEELMPLPCETSLKGTIVFEDANAVGTGVEVVLLDGNLNRLQSAFTDNQGAYLFEVDCKEMYYIRVEKLGYLTVEVAIDILLPTEYTINKIVLVKQKTNFEIGDDLALKLNLLPIYFDLGKYTIRADAEVELTKIKEVLAANPNMTIEIRSHTDSRDTFENNQVLSYNRAKATLNWLVENGIQSSRLNGIGYGETRLLNQCADAVPCSETEHQANRRSEFIVTGN